MQTAETPTLVILDGFLYDQETGERVGFVAPTGEPILYGADIQEADSASKQPWIPTTVNDLEYLMRRRSDLEATIIAKQEQFAMAVATMDAEVKAARSDLQRFDRWYAKPIEEIARENLPRGKKTFTCGFGKVSFTSTKGGIRIEDENAATEWAKEYCEMALYYPSPVIRVTYLPDDQLKALSDMDAELLAKFGFRLDPPSERVKVENIKKR